MPRVKLKPPSFVPPELATLVARAPEGDSWLHEIKFDGYRTAALLVDGKARMLTRGALDWTARFRPIADDVARLRARSAYLDGEIVALNPAGVSDFGSLQEALSLHKPGELVYFVFDLLHLNGRDLRGVPLLERKTVLKRLIASGGANTRVHYSEHFTGRGPRFFKQACRAGLEGIVSKPAASRYRSGRVGEWFKAKCTLRQEFVIGGWRPSVGASRDLASLLLGYYESEKLRYAGKVGTGFDLRLGRDIIALLKRHPRANSPFVEAPRAGARWAEPVIVIDVEFTAWTRDRRIRHPAFKALRQDKDPRQVRAECPNPRQH